MPILLQPGDYTCILEEQEELQASCSNVGGPITVVPLAISAD